MVGLRMRFAALMLLVLPWFGPPAMAAEPIRIGFSMAMTGGLAPNGKQVAAAMDLWREDVNAKGGLLGRPVQFVSYDDQSNPANVPAIYTKLIEVDKVDLIVSPYATNMVVPTIPIAMQHNMVLIGQFALAANTEFKYPRYFAIMPTGPDPKQSIADGYFDLAKQLKPAPKTVAIAYGDAEFARAMADSARLHAQQMGLKIVYDRSYPPTNTDFTPVIHAIQATDPDIVFVGSYPVDSVGIVRAAHEVGLKAQMFGGGMAGLVTTSIEMQLGPLVNGLVVMGFWAPVPAFDFPGIKEVMSRYQARAAKEGLDPLGNLYVPFGYAGMQVLEQAVTGAGNLDQSKLADYLHGHTFKTVTGEMTFGPDGEWLKPGIIYTQFQHIASGDLEQFKDPQKQIVVWPPKIKSGDFIYPYSDAAK
jgi:branched-chain amino acid transport system substrate-binding protein